MFQRLARTLELITAGLIGAIFASMIVLAWTGPTSPPPNGNVAAPINVGGTDQVKNAGLALNSLAVFGNQILSGTSRYLNFGTTAGSSGYGIGDNAGMIELKNSGGSWASLGAGGRIPGEVAAFNLTSCPAGWSPLVTAAGRVIVGVGNNGTNSYTLGNTGGADSISLSVAQLPPHSHSYTDWTGKPYGSWDWSWSLGSGSNGNSVITSQTNTVGSGAAIDTRPSYLALLYCQKN